MNNVSSVLINADRILDYVPVVSTLSNLVILFQKCVLANISYREIKDLYCRHIKDKSAMRCVVLLVPIIGNIIVGLHDLIYGNNVEAPIPKRKKDKDLKLENAGEDIMKVFGGLKDLQDVLKNLNIQVEVPAAVPEENSLLELAGDAMKNNRHVVIMAIKQNPHALKYASPELKNDFLTVLEAVTKDGLTLELAGDTMKNNSHVVKTAIKQNPLALKFASPELKNDFSTVLEAVTKDGLTLELAGDDMKNNSHVVKTAIKQNPLALKFASLQLKNDFATIIEVFNDG